MELEPGKFFFIFKEKRFLKTFKEFLISWEITYMLVTLDFCVCFFLKET